MKKIEIKIEIVIFSILLFLITFLPIIAKSNEGDNSKDIITKPPYFEFILNLNEYSIFNSAIVSALDKYGGVIDFNLKMGKTKSGIIWKITIFNKNDIKTIKQWVGEKTVELVSSIKDFSNLNNNSQIALNTIKTLAVKVDASINNPVWEKLIISGIVSVTDKEIFLNYKGNKYQVTGNLIQTIKQLNGKSIVSEAYIKSKNQIEIIKFLPQNKNTLEIFIMAKCKYALKAVNSICNFINTIPESKKPHIKIHYIFFLKKQGFTSLHGEDEVIENLVQILIRDNYNNYLLKYIEHRLDDNQSNWKDIAKKTGLNIETINNIETKINTKKKSLIQSEYDYVAGLYGVFNKSPAYVWESMKIENLNEIDIFQNLRLPDKRRCSK